MNQNEANAANQPQAQAVAVERTAIFGPGSARATVALLLAVPVLLWAIAVAVALIGGAGS
ncbi:MAG: hypothetical protein JSR45_15715 [Proteobacteria bacterium]|nr:hypothetical protein [Pseudomonadota bacterium]